ncbi:MAG: hypothetical protein EOP22_15340 [Hyphomicrobiales bacterium]|nr:MAG: hypothetical protein EOP22_15340 [Hyphomicrobiales bacterium]
MPDSITDYFRLSLDQNFGVTLHISAGAAGVVAALFVAYFLVSFLMGRRDVADFEIDQAEFGLGDQKVTLRPNDLDRTVAYKIWVELSTRKIGLPIDPKDDVIDEIYASWYEFFSITRELIKDVPVGKVRKQSTQLIINLSIDVLNKGLRPHLTRWQARFRRWFAHQLAKDAEAKLNPQDIQQKFPDYDELVKDMLVVNANLMAYREKMRLLVSGLQKDE